MPDLISVVIPARLASTRLPGKVLADLGGKPVLRHVWERCVDADVGPVTVATDDVTVLAAVRGWGGRGLLTPASCRTGTDRVAACMADLDARLVVNVQADEPFLPETTVQAVATALIAHPETVCTPVYPILDPAVLDDPSVVKVVRRNDGTALYFSRAAIPHVRGIDGEDRLGAATYLGHVGVYGYASATLRTLVAVEQAALERAEQLEQLRWMAAGVPVLTVDVAESTLGIDTPADLDRARELIHPSPDGGVQA